MAVESPDHEPSAIRISGVSGFTILFESASFSQTPNGRAAEFPVTQTLVRLVLNSASGVRISVDSKSSTELRSPSPGFDSAQTIGSRWSASDPSFGSHQEKKKVGSLISLAATFFPCW